MRKRKGKLHAGAYELGALLDDGTFQAGGTSEEPSAPHGYQDRLAIHRDTPGLKRGARVYLVPQQTTVERRQLLRRAADREVQLLCGVSEHPNVLTFFEYIDNRSATAEVNDETLTAGTVNSVVGFHGSANRCLGSRRLAITFRARIVATGRDSR